MGRARRRSAPAPRGDRDGKRSASGRVLAQSAQPVAGLGAEVAGVERTGARSEGRVQGAGEVVLAGDGDAGLAGGVDLQHHRGGAVFQVLEDVGVWRASGRGGR